MNNAAMIVARFIAMILVGICCYMLGVINTQRKVDFPFHLTYRKAITGNGYVAQVRNISAKSQAVKVTLHNPTFNQTKAYSLVVDARNFKEIGYLEGWTLASGDKITLECNGDVQFFNIP